MENLDTPVIREMFAWMLDNWTNEGFDPFASPQETGSAFGFRRGNNSAAVTRHRVTAGTPTPDGRDLGDRAWSLVCFDMVLAPARA